MKLHIGLAALAALALGACDQAKAPSAAASAPVANAIEPQAMAVIEGSCARLAAARTMSFTAVNTYEKPARTGQPLFYTTLNRVTMQRPDKLRVITPGDGTPDEFYYDGRTMMAYVPSADIAAVEDAPPSIDQLLQVVWQKAAIYFPFDDVIVTSPCDTVRKRATSAFYVGRSVVVGGVPTDMVAVAGPDMQAELWIGADDQLPRMIRVVYPKDPQKALYQTEYSNWRLDAALPPGTFTSARAVQARRIAFQPPGPLAGMPPRPAQAR